ncbi:hypothetical protein DL95DRAFT_402111 [Leptodontidium sp. 2 PMI_412]|nr:hypothetical protein DL95DRAFT_402111 [Leptodontidium sp. 2 PMI_412]
MSANAIDLGYRALEGEDKGENDDKNESSGESSVPPQNAWSTGHARVNSADSEDPLAWSKDKYLRNITETADLADHLDATHIGENPKRDSSLRSSSTSQRCKGKEVQDDTTHPSTGASTGQLPSRDGTLVTTVREEKKKVFYYFQNEEEKSKLKKVIGRKALGRSTIRNTSAWNTPGRGQGEFTRRGNLGKD